jgi:hypothetical protein
LTAGIIRSARIPSSVEFSSNVYPAEQTSSPTPPIKSLKKNTYTIDPLQHPNAQTQTP